MTAWSHFRKRVFRLRYAYLLLLPGLIHLLLFRYTPMFGVVVSFQNYSPFLGFWDSPWVGFKHFNVLFHDHNMLRVLKNTLILSFLQIAFAFPAPLILALMLNELRQELFKRVLQSVLYLPHFLSWVIVVGIVFIFLRNDGLINTLLKTYTDIGAIPFLTSAGWFRPLIITEVIWKEVGWGTIIFLAALSGINPEWYEAAAIDGASRLRRIWHITLPGIRSTFVILLILRIGDVLDTGFEQSFLQMNALNQYVAETLDITVYLKGLGGGNQYSFSTAIGLLKSVVGLVLIVLANRTAKRFGEDGIY